jgi:hypothetical protein
MMTKAKIRRHDPLEAVIETALWPTRSTGYGRGESMVSDLEKAAAHGCGRIKEPSPLDRARKRWLPRIGS